MECDCYNMVQQAFNSNSATLCYSCIGKASKFGKLQDQLCQLKEEMASVLRRNLVTTDSAQPRIKRPAQPSKRARVSVRQLVANTQVLCAFMDIINMINHSVRTYALNYSYAPFVDNC